MRITPNIEKMKISTKLISAMSNSLTSKLLLLAFALLSTVATQAQESDEGNELFRLGFEARFDYLNQTLDGDKLDEASGIKFRYLNMRMDGKIGKMFNYSWRQRLTKMYNAGDFVDNTDWLYLNFQPTKNWGIAAGKQVVLIGGWEYDRAPIDLYFCSEYWNNVVCYSYGASVTYTTNKGNDSISFQACQSPYDTKQNDLFAYNLYWMGKHGCYTALHSLNFSEYDKGKYNMYIVLGNQFKFGDATIQLDLMNRGINGRELLFKDFSIMGEVAYLIADRVNIFARASYDYSDSERPTGLFVYPGTNLTRVGGGVEYYPLGGKGNRDVRLHAAYAYGFGTNGNPAGTILDNQGYLTVGLTWRIDVISAIGKIVNKVEAKRDSKM